MANLKVFISFDFDHDDDLKVMLLGQAKNPDTPFDIKDMSLKQPLTGDWKEKIRPRIQAVEQMAVICGEHLDTAVGVNAEIQIAQEEGIPYFLLCGRSNNRYKRPAAARSSDKVYDWTWPNLKALIAGGR